MSNHPMFTKGEYASDKFLVFKMDGHNWLTDFNILWREDVLGVDLPRPLWKAEYGENPVLVHVWEGRANEGLSDFDEDPDWRGRFVEMGLYQPQSDPREKLQPALAEQGEPFVPTPWELREVDAPSIAAWTSESASWTTWVNCDLTAHLRFSHRELSYDQPRELAPIRALRNGEPVGLLMPCRRYACGPVAAAPEVTV